MAEPTNLPVDKLSTGSIASSRSRSTNAASTRAIRRTPVGWKAPVQMPERTSPCEGPCVSLARHRPAMRQHKPMKNWTEQNHFAGFDWASDHHDVVIVDRAGQVLTQLRFTHDADGWELFRDKIKAFADLAVAIETSCGAAVEQLLQSGCTVYPVLGRSSTIRLTAPKPCVCLRLSGTTLAKDPLENVADGSCLRSGSARA